MEPVNENKDEELKTESEEVKAIETEATAAEDTKAEETAEAETVKAESAEESAEAEITEETKGETVEAAAAEEAKEKAEAATTEETKAGEAVIEEIKPEDIADAQTPEEAREMLKKKIKIGVVIAGGIFIIIAAVFMAAVLGGRNVSIEADEPVEEVEEVVEEPAITEEAPVVVEEETEEEDDSLIAVIKSSNKYDDCVYADGGVIIVEKEEKYGAIDYMGNEIVPLSYEELIQYPTAEGLFVLANSKNQTVKEDNEGTSYSYEDVVTTYTLFDNAGKKIYEGNNQVVASKNTYVLGIEDKKDSRQNRAEYYRIGKSEAYMTLYVNDQFSLNGFKDGKTVVMGFSAVPTEDQDTNPTNLNCGIMDENGKVTWFTTVPGMPDFEKKVEEWKAENKELQIEAQKNKKQKKKQTKKSEDTDETDDDESEEDLEEDDGVVYFDEDGNIIEKEDVDEEDEELDDEEDEEADEELDEEDEVIDENDVEEIDTSNGPVFKMGEILSAPCGGFFIYKDLYDVEDPFSLYTDDGKWFADLDTAYMQPDDKKGFVVGNFNNGSVDIKDYVSSGERYYNYGSLMVIRVGEKDVMIDISAKEGMKVDSLSDKIVVAVYDEIRIADANYWMYRDGGVCGYLDLKGERVKLTYEAATDFVDGYALVIKNGKASIINENFDVVEELFEAEEVAISGDVFSITSNGEAKQYILKTTRDEAAKK